MGDSDSLKLLCQSVVSGGYQSSRLMAQEKYSIYSRANK